MLVSVPEQVVTVLHDVVQVSEADEDRPAVEQNISHVEIGEAEQELDEELEEPSDEASDVAVGVFVNVIVRGVVSGAISTGPTGFTAGIYMHQP